MYILLYMISAFAGFKFGKFNATKSKGVLIHYHVSLGIGILLANIIAAYVGLLATEFKKLLMFDIWLSYGIFLFVSWFTIREYRGET